MTWLLDVRLHSMVESASQERSVGCAPDRPQREKKNILSHPSTSLPEVGYGAEQTFDMYTFFCFSHYNSV